MEQMSLNEFKEKYMGTESTWKFDLFKIVCQKCHSEKVEFNGYLETESGYYGAASANGKIIIKCHDCGNASVIKLWGDRSLNTDGEKWKDKCLICDKEDSENHPAFNHTFEENKTTKISELKCGTCQNYLSIDHPILNILGSRGLWIPVDLNAFSKYVCNHCGLK